MEAGDLVFVREKGIIPSIIRFFDKGKFNHVAIAIDDTHILEAEYNTRVRIIENPYTDIEVVPLKIKDKSKVKRFAAMNIGKKYDFGEIVRIWLRLVFGWSWFSKFNTPKEVVCSELAGDFLQYVGIAPKGSELLAPNELYREIKSLGY